ncbi:MAG: ABC transporter permease [Corynebacterium humireducens]|uniref:ABC transporter permease n=1 Tax=Corynebacterium humireducens TaxID=1223514 RepID=A0A7X6PPS8_9CORY|nr:ABC transporter permease [Corynebacterium humireducens]
MSTLTGTGALLRFMLRRDRLRLPLWVLGMGLMALYISTALGTVLDEEALQGMAEMAATPVMALIGGPGYGFDAITVPRFFAGLYGAYLMLGAALMSMTTLSRHTRAEEQSGRGELVLADVVGRHAQLTAALLLAVLMNVLVAATMTGIILVAPIDPSPAAGPTALFTLSIASVGIAFAGVAAATVQLSPYSRTCTSLAGIVLAVAFLVRGIGDMSRSQGGNLDWLSWLSPLGWAQQTAPYTLDRWWPLAFPLLFAAVGAGLGYVLRSRRDFGAGVLADRLGRERAASWLGTPLTLAYRLQRGVLIGWSVAMILTGLTLGAFTQSMADVADTLPEELLAVMGGDGAAEAFVDGYLGFMSVYFGVILAVFAILAVQSLRVQETEGHTESVLSTAVGRVQWVLSWVTVTGLGALWLAALAGLGEAVGAVLVTGDWSLVGPTLLGHTVQFSVVWFFLGVAVALYGLAPRLVGLVWVLYVVGSVLIFFGPMLGLSQAWLNLSPFQHTGQHPATDVQWLGIAALSLGGVALALLGASAFRRRDLSA